MKKTAFAVLIAAMSVCATAFADSEATYTGSADNSTEVTETTGYSTVLIGKVSDDAGQSNSVDESKIVYVNDVPSTIDGVADFMIKANPAYGKYRVQFGSSSGVSGSTYFYIGVDTPTADGDTAMTRLGEKKVDGLWRVGYALEIDPEQYNDYSAIKVAFDSGSTVAGVEAETVTIGGYNLKDNGYPETVVSGTGNVKLAFQINYVPEEYKDSITVFLSSSSLTDNKLFSE